MLTSLTTRYWTFVSAATALAYLSTQYVLFLCLKIFQQKQKNISHITLPRLSHHFSKHHFQKKSAVYEAYGLSLSKRNFHYYYFVLAIF